MLAVELEEAALREAADDLDHLVHARAARLPDLSAEPVVLGPGARGPTPKPKRLPVSTATDAADFATSTGCRIGSFTTKVVKRSRSVTAPIAGISEKGSMKGLSSRKLAIPVGRVGILAVGVARVGDAVRHTEGSVARLLGRDRERQVVARIAHRLGIGKAHVRLALALQRRRGRRGR